MQNSATADSEMNNTGFVRTWNAAEQKRRRMRQAQVGMQINAFVHPLLPNSTHAKFQTRGGICHMTGFSLTDG